MREAQVVRIPSVQMLSLTAMGTPHNRPTFSLFLILFLSFALRLEVALLCRFSLLFIVDLFDFSRCQELFFVFLLVTFFCGNIVSLLK